MARCCIVSLAWSVETLLLRHSNDTWHDVTVQSREKNIEMKNLRQ